MLIVRLKAMALTYEAVTPQPKFRAQGSPFKERTREQLSQQWLKMHERCQTKGIQHVLLSLWGDPERVTRMHAQYKFPNGLDQFIAERRNAVQA